jgi:hypothetical protein
MGHIASILQTSLDRQTSILVKRTPRRTRKASFLLVLAACPILAQSRTNSPQLHPAILPDAPSATLQQAQAPPQETDAQRIAREQREEAAREVAAEEKQRIGGVVPNFNVVLTGHAAPITPSQKFSIALHSIIDPYTIGLAAIAGGYGEITDDQTGYGHGPAGYFKRFGAAYADNADGTIIGNAILPSLLHQDPRYYRKGTGSIKSRAIYSALTTFICHGDNGKRQFNTSNVLGNFIAGGISNLYYPSDERGFGLTIENASLVTVEGMLGAQILEFSPDVLDYLHRRRQAKRDRKAAAAQPTTPANP